MTIQGNGGTGIGVLISDGTLLINHASLVLLEFGIVATYSDVTVTRGFTIANYYTANITLGTFTATSGTLYQDSFGIRSYDASVVLSSMTFQTDPAPAGSVLRAIGGQVWMNSVKINAYPGTYSYPFYPMVYLEDTHGTFVDVLLHAGDGDSKYRPGGFALIRSTALLNNVTISYTGGVQGFEPIRASYFDQGGAFFFESSNITMQNCRASYCRAGNGGGVYAVKSNLTVENCTFDSNSAVLASNLGVCGGKETCQGGGCYINASMVTFTNTVFKNNSATFGGGVFVGGGIFPGAGKHANLDGILMNSIFYHLSLILNSIHRELYHLEQYRDDWRRAYVHKQQHVKLCHELHCIKKFFTSFLPSRSLT